MNNKSKECVAILLAGGQGSRLKVLTEETAKPAVPFGGKYRIIDFPLSNCVNSGIDTVGILTQEFRAALGLSDLPFGRLVTDRKRDSPRHRDLFFGNFRSQTVCGGGNAQHLCDLAGGEIRLDGDFRLGNEPLRTVFHGQLIVFGLHILPR